MNDATETHNSQLPGQVKEDQPYLGQQLHNITRDTSIPKYFCA